MFALLRGHLGGGNQHIPAVFATQVARSVHMRGASTAPSFLAIVHMLLATCWYYTFKGGLRPDWLHQQ